MYKRKRLYDRMDSYRETGIPCGNPKRVQTGEVMCMPSAANAASTPRGPAALAQAAAQMAEGLRTQGEEQLRVMAQKQLHTKVTMQELSSQHRQFTEAGQYKPVLKEVRGVLRLHEYEDLAKGDERVERLRQCGLADDEIRLHVAREEGTKGQNSAGTSRSTYGTNPDVEEDQLQAIDSKIRDKEASMAVQNSFRGLKQISRQEMDIEKSMFRGTHRSSEDLTNLLTDKKREVTGDPNDPINHLPQLMADIEERAQEKIREKRRKRRRNRRQGNKTGVSGCSVGETPQEDDSEDEQGRIIGCLTAEETLALKQSQKVSEDTDEQGTSSVSDSVWKLSESAMHSKCVSGQNYSHNSSGSKETGQASNMESVEESETVAEDSEQSDRRVLKGPIEFLPVDYIKENQLTLQQIRNLPKFANYEAGSPSNVLYVKNLAPRCCEGDLVSLFGRFQKGKESPVVYRLMTGRMRGQAFVSFDNTDLATEAQQLVNGFVLHGKPVIVQYGRRTAA